MEPNNWQSGLKTGKYDGFIGLILVNEVIEKVKSQTLLSMEMNSVNGRVALLH